MYFSVIIIQQFSQAIQLFFTPVYGEELFLQVAYYHLSPRFFDFWKGLSQNGFIIINVPYKSGIELETRSTCSFLKAYKIVLQTKTSVEKAQYCTHCFIEINISFHVYLPSF